MITILSWLTRCVLCTRYKLAKRGAAAAEAKYTQLALAAEQVAREPKKPGNGKPPALEESRVRTRLDKVVSQRDEAEELFFVRQGRAEARKVRLEKFSSWRGWTIPYLVGSLDVVLTKVVAVAILLAVAPLSEWPEKYQPLAVALQQVANAVEALATTS
jgi:hypothetical protein